MEFLLKTLLIERVVCKEIKINRRPVPEAQCDRGSTVKHESRTNARSQLRPNFPLRRRQHLKMRFEAAHSTFLTGIGGTGILPTSARPSR